MKGQFDPQPVVLNARHVRLEPLTLDHAGGLHIAGADAAIWRWLPIAPPKGPEDIRSYVAEALRIAKTGDQVPFAIIHKDAGTPVGSTRYLDIQRDHSALEIGWTWIGAPWQRTAVNTECKFLLLRHAFEDLGAIRVQLKTDGRNERSQRAIERLGATKEGVLRRSRRLWDGYVRDTVVYSILAEEWPAVKERLEDRMS